MNGRIESSWLADNSAVIALFENIGTQVRSALEQIKDFNRVTELMNDNDALARHTAASIERIREQIDQLTGRVPEASLIGA
jgi:hypothetical protein